MSGRYEDVVSARLAQVYFQGFAVFQRWELLHWSGRERITKSVYRDLQSMYEEVADNDEAELHISEEQGDVVLINPKLFEPMLTRL